MSEDKFPHRKQIEIRNGCVLVGSDFHIWPGSAPTALRAFKKFCRELDPIAVVLNGDVLDFPNISRHQRIGWTITPNPAEEIETAKKHLDEINSSLRRNCRRVWNLGNHDIRFETYIANTAPEYRNVRGFSLSDHFSNWDMAWSCWINDSVVIKHKYRGGIHAPRNNTIHSGRTILTGHLHSQKITPFTDYNGTRYGVDTGCIADTDHKAFVDYTEDNPLDWRSGFCVLTFKDGKLLCPELVTKWDEGMVQFRGEIIKC